MNPFKNILRMPKKTIILAVTMLILSIVLMAVLYLKQTTDQSIREMIGPLSDTVEVISDTPIKTYTYKIKKLYEGFDCIVGYHTSTSVYCNIDEITPLKPPEKDKKIDSSYNRGDFTVCGTTSTDILSEFYGGDCVITSGSGISREEFERKVLKVVVSEELAEFNGITVGDKLTVNMQTARMTNADIKPITLIVGGIYSRTQPLISNALFSYQMPQNIIYVPLSVMDYCFNEANENLSCDNLYLELEKPTDAYIKALEDRFNDFAGEYFGIGQSGVRKITLNKFTPENEAGALYKMSNIFSISIVAVIACMAITLALIIIFHITSRVRELAVLCALGAKRHAVARMIAVEMLTVLAIAFVISILIFTIILTSFGDDIHMLMHLDAFGSTVYATTCDTVGAADIEQEYAEWYFGDIDTLINKVVLPISAKAMIVILVLFIPLYIGIYVSLKKIEVMRVLGGRAE